MRALCVEAYILSAIIATSTFGWFFPQKGEIYPHENLIVRNISDLPNKTLTLECSITADYFDDVGRNSSFLFWEFESNVPNSGGLSRLNGYIIDNRTIGLLLTNATEDDSGIYYCRMTEENFPVLIDHANVILGNPPDPVSDIVCVSDRFLDMTCTWCPDSNEFMGWTLQYRINSGNWRTCHKDLQSTCSCYFTGSASEADEGNPFEWYYTYDFQVKASTIDFGHAWSDILPVVTDPSIVRPGPVEDLSVRVLNSTALSVSWQPDPYTKAIHDENKILYVLEYRGNDTIQEVAVGSATSVVLSSLHPYTEYVVKVKSKTTTSPLKDVYWSTWESAINTTFADAPEVGPALQPGALKKTQCPPSSCVQVFWQEISESQKNGPLGGYRITEFRSDGQNISSRVSADSFSKSVHIVSGQSVTVGVEAYTLDTVNGLEHFSPMSTVWIDGESQWLAVPDLVVQTSDANETGVLWSWTYNLQPDNFTLFMCERHMTDGTKCQTSPVTISVPGTARDYHVEGFNPNYVYAMAANLQAKTSGLKGEWVPLCRYNERPGSTEFSVSARAERSLHVTWTPVQCSSDVPTGLVLNYTLYWNNQADADNVTVDALVTEYTIPGLDPFTEYNVTVVATARAGDGPTPAHKAGQTLESVPDDGPREVTVVNTTSSSVTLKWLPPQIPNGIIISYTITAQGGTANRTATTSSVETTVQELDGFVNYTLDVIAVNGAGPSPPSDDMHAVTFIRAPSQVTEVSLTTLGELRAQLQVEWAAPIPPNGPIEGYFVTVTGSDNGVIRNETAGSQTLSHTLEFGDYCQDYSSRVEVFLSVSAFTLNEGDERMVGPASDPQRTEICDFTNNIPFYVWIIMGVVIAVLFLVVIILYIRRLKKNHEKKLDFKYPEAPEIYKKMGDHFTVGHTNAGEDTSGDHALENGSLKRSRNSSDKSQDSGVGKSESESNNSSDPSNPDHSPLLQSLAIQNSQHGMIQSSRLGQSAGLGLEMDSQTFTGSYNGGTDKGMPRYDQPTDKHMKEAPSISVSCNEGVRDSSKFGHENEQTHFNNRQRVVEGDHGVLLLDHGKSIPSTISSANQNTAATVDPYSKATTEGVMTEESATDGTSRDNRFPDYDKVPLQDHVRVIQPTDDQFPNYDKVPSQDHVRVIQPRANRSHATGNSYTDPLQNGVVASGISNHRATGESFEGIVGSSAIVSSQGNTIDSYNKVGQTSAHTLSSLPPPGLESDRELSSKQATSIASHNQLVPNTSENQALLKSHIHAPEIGSSNDGISSSDQSSSIDACNEVALNFSDNSASFNTSGSSSGHQSGEAISSNHSSIDPYSQVAVTSRSDGHATDKSSDTFSGQQSNLGSGEAMSCDNGSSIDPYSKVTAITNDNHAMHNSDSSWSSQQPSSISPYSKFGTESGQLDSDNHTHSTVNNSSRNPLQDVADRETGQPLEDNISIHESDSNQESTIDSYSKVGNIIGQTLVSILPPALATNQELSSDQTSSIDSYSQMAPDSSESHATPNTSESHAASNTSESHAASNTSESWMAPNSSENHAAPNSSESQAAPNKSEGRELLYTNGSSSETSPNSGNWSVGVMLSEQDSSVGSIGDSYVMATTSYSFGGSITEVKERADLDSDDSFEDEANVDREAADFDFG